MDYKNTSFKDLIVYQNLYKAAITIMTYIVPKLPDSEKYNLKEQIKRSCMSPCALIAEGYAKKHQSKNWVKYINDAMGECNEMLVHLSFVKDLYAKYVSTKLCDELITIYDISGKQLYRLGQSWNRRV